MKAIVTDKNVVIVGLGVTGLSCVHYLKALGHNLTVMDSRDEPPGFDELKAKYPNIECIFGGFDRERLLAADEIILSPGIAMANEDIQAAIASGVPVKGDVALFSEAAKAPIIAITGSNGKSTVTTLVGDMAECAGLNVGVGGNLGIPALDLLEQDRQLYVLELSSFQLETTENLNAHCAVILNITEDHMDRYPEKMAYLQAKQRVFRGAKYVAINDDEVLSQPLMSTTMKAIHFGLQADLNKYSIIERAEKQYLAKGFDALLAVNELKVSGEHNQSNVLAAMALASSVGIPTQAMLDALKSFKGLPHRCQHVRTLDDVDYINDSKGTNPGAVVTAISSLGKNATGKVILIAGGESKGADFSPMRRALSEYCKLVILFGRDAEEIGKITTPLVESVTVDSFEQSVKFAYESAEPGDVVLLSPGCASFDMFKNYQQRGEAFERLVMCL